MYPAASGWRAARRDGPRPAAPQAGRARVHPGYNVRYAALAAASRLVAGSPTASGTEAAAVASW
jgi:hypothetical protein